MNRPFPVAAEVLLCLAALAFLVAVSYLSRWVRQVMNRRFPKAPVTVPGAAEQPPDVTVYIEGPLIMSAPDRPFTRAREPQ